MNPPVTEEPEEDVSEGQEPEVKPEEDNAEEGTVSEKPVVGDQVTQVGNNTVAPETTDKKEETSQNVQSSTNDVQIETDATEEIELENSEEKESEETAQENVEEEITKKIRKINVGNKILAFFKKIFYNIASWISNLFGGKD